MSSLLYVSNQRMPTEKAYGFQIAKMCEAFAGAGWEVSLVIPSRTGTSAEGIFSAYTVRHNFPVVVVGSPEFHFPGAFDWFAVVAKSLVSAYMLARKVRTHQADIVYSRDAVFLLFLSWLQPRQRMMFEAHRVSSWHSWIYRRLQNVGCRCVAISQGLKDQLIDAGFRADAIMVAHDGVDIGQFAVSKPQAECRQELGLPLDRKLIGYVGQLTTFGKEKGVETLLEAFSILHKRKVRMMGVIVGGSARDMAVHKERAEQFGLDNAVRFTGFQPHAIIPSYLHAMDILVMPFPYTHHYAYTMSPLKLFEYMAAEKPIVATDLPTIREIVGDEDVFFAWPNDSVSLADAIARSLSDVLGSAQKAARTRILADNFTWYARAQHILDFARKPVTILLAS